MRLHTVVLALMLVPITASAAELVAPQHFTGSDLDGQAMTSIDSYGRTSAVISNADGTVTRSSEAWFAPTR
jgi:hypothetical protein